MKRLTALPAGFLLAFAAPALASPALLTINPVQTVVAVGDGLSVTVNLQPNLIPPLLGDGNSVAGFQFDLLFPTFVQATNVIEDGYFHGNGCCFFFSGIDNTNGVVSGINDIAFPGQTTQADLVTIDFTAIAAGSGAFGLQNVALSDDNGNSIPFIPLDAFITVVPGQGPGSPAPEPSCVVLFFIGALACLLGRVGRTKRLQNAQPPV